MDGFISDIALNMVDEKITPEGIQKILLRDYFSIDYIESVISVLKEKGLLEDVTVVCDKTADLFEVAA